LTTTAPRKNTDRMLRTNPSDYADLVRVQQALGIKGGIRHTVAHLVAYALTPEGMAARARPPQEGAAQ